MKTVLFYAREAGVASMIAALEEPFLDAGFRLFYDVAGDAADILRGGAPWKVSDLNVAICGYDDPILDRTGDFLSKIAGLMPTLGLLDSWKGVDRFWYSDGRLRQLTDRLIVPDEGVRNYLLARGVPFDWPVVAGHPGLECMRGFSTGKRKLMRKEARSVLGLSEYVPVLLVLSEPFRLPDGNRLSLLDARVVNGESVKDWLDDIYANDYRIALRLHPLEHYKVPFGWIDAGNVGFDLALAAADRVIGLGSTTLAYAVAYGLDVQCLDNQVVGWVPEFSDIPTELWDGLISLGIFQNDPNRLDSHLPNLDLNDSSHRILAEVERLVISP
ncbi:MAG: hypothetical protein OEY01_06700 [Desulfobulbaceae bacterium]|nr:hypothetical protein [Desulfobulbaceae bacterium]